MRQRCVECINTNGAHMYPFNWKILIVSKLWSTECISWKCIDNQIEFLCSVFVDLYLISRYQRIILQRCCFIFCWSVYMISHTHIYNGDDYFFSPWVPNQYNRLSGLSLPCTEIYIYQPPIRRDMCNQRTNPCGCVWDLLPSTSIWRNTVLYRFNQTNLGEIDVSTHIIRVNFMDNSQNSQCHQFV